MIYGWEKPDIYFSLFSMHMSSFSGKMIDYSQKDFGRSKRQYGCFFKMLVHGQAGVLILKAS